MGVDSLKRVGLCWCVDRVAAAPAHASQAVSASCHCNQNFCPPSVSDTHLQIRRAPRSAATWVDVIWSILRRTVTKLWWDVFLSLVHDNMLNRTDPIHLECIRLCFLPVVQCHLDPFKDTWNHHRMRANRRNDKCPPYLTIFIIYPCVME